MLTQAGWPQRCLKCSKLAGRMSRRSATISSMPTSRASSSDASTAKKPPLRLPLGMGETSFQTIPAHTPIPAAESSQTSTISPTAFLPKRPRSIFIESLDADKFLSYVKQGPPEPILLTSKTPILKQSRTVLDVMLDDREADNCVVDLELGRYDQPGFEQVQLPLRSYLKWLMDGQENGKMNGKQVYLAQWRGLEALPSLRASLDPPRFLAILIRQQHLDLYQASFFVGPTAAVTPVHYDPYINLFRLASTSSRYAGKHFLILPPTESINEALRPGDGTGQRNTSSVEFELVRDGPSLDAIKVDVVSDSLNDDSKELIKKEAFGVTLKVGEMLLLPHRWWHRAENIGTPQCWTAGVGYWFRAR